MTNEIISNAQKCHDVPESDLQYLKNWRELVLYMGYDLENYKDRERLIRNNILLNELREAADNKKNNSPAIKIAIATTCIATIITVVLPWILNLFK